MERPVNMSPAEKDAAVVEILMNISAVSRRLANNIAKMQKGENRYDQSGNDPANRRQYGLAGKECAAFRGKYAYSYPR